MMHKSGAMPVARGDIAPSLQLRRAPVMPMTLRQPTLRVLQTSRTPRQLSLFEHMMRPTRPVEPEPASSDT